MIRIIAFTWYFKSQSIVYRTHLCEAPPPQAVFFGVVGGVFLGISLLENIPMQPLCDLKPSFCCRRSFALSRVRSGCLLLEIP